MADIAAALAACTLFLWVMGVALMGTTYQGLGVMLSVLGFLTGTAHAFVQRLPVRIQPTGTVQSFIDQQAQTKRSEAMTDPVAPPVVRHHPIEGRENAFTAWIGFFSTVIISIVLFSVLTGQWVPPTFTISDEVKIGPEIYVPVTALIFYRYQERVSLTRPDNLFYAWLDLIGSAMVLAVAAMGVASWFPAVSWVLTHVGLPLADFTTLTVVAAFTYLVLSGWDVFWNHWRRSRVFAHNVGENGELLNSILAGKGAIGPFTITPEVIVEPVYKVRQPDGSLRTVQPELIAGPPTH